MQLKYLGDVIHKNLQDNKCQDEVVIDEEVAEDDMKTVIEESILRPIVTSLRAMHLTKLNKETKKVMNNTIHVYFCQKPIQIMLQNAVAEDAEQTTIAIFGFIWDRDTKLELKIRKEYLAFIKDIVSLSKLFHQKEPLANQTVYTFVNINLTYIC